MQLSKLVAVTALSMAVSTNAYSAGVKNSLDMAVVEQAKNVYFNEIVDLINNL